jgi:hypothetical protein
MFKIFFRHRHGNNTNLCHSVHHLKTIKWQLWDSRRTLDFLILVCGVAAGNLDTWASNRTIGLNWEDGKIFGKQMEILEKIPAAAPYFRP